MEQKFKTIGSTFLKILLISLVVAFAFWIANLARTNDFIKESVSTYGYWGIFLVSIASGFNFFVPLPAISFLPLYLESGLNYYKVILVITAGMTVADGIAYFIGHAGREIAKFSMDQNMLLRLDKMRIEHYWWPIAFLFFFASLAPFPNEIMVVPLAFLGYRLRHILVAIFFGSILFNIIYSQGLLRLFDLIY